MGAEWYDIALKVLGLVGGTSGLIALYNAKANKNTVEIENFKRLFDEAQEERERMKELYTAYEEKTDSKIKELENKISSMEQKNTVMVRAVNSAYRCTFTAHIGDCPVLKTLDRENPESKKDCIN